MHYNYVYVAKSKLFKSLYKIGVTNDEDQRMESLRLAGAGLDYFESYYMASENGRTLEKQIHSYYESRRLPQSEWFKLNRKQLTHVHRWLEDHSQYSYEASKSLLNYGL